MGKGTLRPTTGPTTFLHVVCVVISSCEPRVCYERSSSKELFLAILRFFSRALEDAMNVVKSNTEAGGDVVVHSFTMYQGGKGHG